MMKFWAVVLILCGAGWAEGRPSGVGDPRDIRMGLTIPDEGYCDQPYVVIRPDGAWLCTLTTGAGVEGDRGQHVVAIISKDQGASWTSLIDIEPADGPEASWVMPLIARSGRVYVFYDYNGEHVSTLPGSNRPIRTDMLGWYAYKYSDDGGETWSQRFCLPVRTTACDRANDWHGDVQIMWGIGKPIVSGGSAYFGFTKLGRYMLDYGEGWFFRSDNILTESDPSRIEWQMLPDGDNGLRAPELGSVQEEHNLVNLGNGDLYCIYRTTNGFPCQAYSRDGGHTWTYPVPATYSPGGQRIKHPRACPKLFRTSSGRFLLWYHNHGGKSFMDRNPAWMSGGVERDGHICWSQPEILLYDPNPDARMSYPDLIEQNGRFWITETQKETARVHELDTTLLEGMWRQGEDATIASDGLIVEYRAGGKVEVSTAGLPNLVAGDGFTIDMCVRLDSLAAGQILLDSRDAQGRGLTLRTTHAGTICLDMFDGVNAGSWDTDPGVLSVGSYHHVVAIVDGGPKIVTFVVDGVLCDGGAVRQFGWGRFADALGDVQGTGTARLDRQIKSLRIYDRYLRTSEAVGNYTAERDAMR